MDLRRVLQVIDLPRNVGVLLPLVCQIRSCRAAFASHFMAGEAAVTLKEGTSAQSKVCTAFRFPTTSPVSCLLPAGCLPDAAGVVVVLFGLFRGGFDLR